MDRDRGNKYDRERELERNGHSTTMQHTRTFDVEPVSGLTFPSTPTTLIENFIRSDVVAQIVAEATTNELKNPKLLDVLFNSPQFHQALIQFFSSAQGSEVLKILAQSASSVPATPHHIPNSAHTPMHIDGHIQPPTIFNVANWNVLAPSFGLPRFYPYCGQENLNPNIRFQKIFDTLIKLSADVICLQEMERGVHDSLAKLLARDYKGTFAGHKKNQDGCSLFIKNSLGEVEFGSLELSHDKSAATAYVKNYGFWICSVHLTGDPKQVQTRRIEIQRALEVSQRDPVLIAGDFNEEEDGSAYAHLQSVGLTSACKQIHGREPVRTFKTDKLDRAIDFIFSSAHFKAVGFECMEIPASACLPNEKVPSDHVYLYARLAFMK